MPLRVETVKEDIPCYLNVPIIHPRDLWSGYHGGSGSSSGFLLTGLLITSGMGLSANARIIRSLLLNARQMVSWQWSVRKSGRDGVV
jgi:hypothetical protein